jgi:hypothetical protein
MPQIFWSEAQAQVFITENWNILRQLCNDAGLARIKQAP